MVLNCQNCQQAFEHDDRVVSLHGKIFHEVECLTDYVIQNLAGSEPQTYLEYLEDMVRGESLWD